MLRFPALIFLSVGLALGCDRSSQDTDKNSSPTPGGQSRDADVNLRPRNATCLAFTRPDANTGIKLEKKSGGLPQIIGLHQKADTKRWYAVQRTGQISTFTKDDGSDRSSFLDLSRVINSRPGEGGLLGMAWHPQRSDEFYLSYTIASSDSPANLRSVIARFKSKDGLTAAAEPEVLLTLEQPYENHNGGHIAFGPDGYLYIAFGDGGSGGDPQNRAQNLNLLFGKILRIDVDGAKPYAIPQDNPFVNQPDRKGEIYAYGLRNTWRFQFDRATGDLWAGDVGQNRLEEIDRIEKGGNYGWRLKEANECYNGSDCSHANVIDPVAYYGRDLGASVTGGFVYRGNAIPSLKGHYVFADFVSGNIFGLFPDESGKLTLKKLLSNGFNISSFAEDADGELYVLEYGAGNIHRIQPENNSLVAVAAPAKLSETGCFLANDPRQPTPGLIPYDVNSPLWSDGAAKRRWMALPDNGKIDLTDGGDFLFPSGTVLVKEFSLGGKRVETRLFIRHEDSVWAGYSYAWNDEESDAVLVPNGASKKIGDQVWTFPSQAQCLQCHNANVDFSLGLELAQLNRKLTIDGKEESQLDHLEALGLFTKALPTERAKLPVPGATADHEGSARSYLHANCSFCHQPNGTGGGNLDMRFQASLKETGLCDQPELGDLGLGDDARILFPGVPEKSVLLSRLSRRGSQQMPPLATSVVDDSARVWVESWIKGMKSCP